MNGIWILRHRTLGMRLLVCRGATLCKADIAALEDAGWDVSYGEYGSACDTAGVRDFVSRAVEATKS